MTTRPPADIGMTLAEVDTPALLVDLDAFEQNLDTLAKAVAGSPVRLRPHAKTHKCAVIAMRQMALGAVGVCCQKVGEAEAMVHGGVGDVLISNQIVGAPKLRRIASLARLARVGVCADDPLHVSTLSEAAAAYGVEIPVYVEINVGANRCGVEPGEPVAALAKAIEGSPGLSFGGLQAYHGSAQHIRDRGERGAAIQSCVDKVNESIAALKRAGIACPAVTGAGTGSYEFEAASGVFTELQAGSYIFMDADYARNLDAGGGFLSTFAHSLFVYATVMSKPSPAWAVVDAGLKALSVDFGMPTLVGYEGAEYTRASDEHGKIEISNPDCGLKLGDKVKLIPGHCDPTANLYDWYVGLRGDRVEALWPIAARGALR